MGRMATVSRGSKSLRPDFNYQMCILSVIGIIFVVLGHLKNDFSSAGTFYGWFPYYSFHMPLFFFISGYFYKDSQEQNFAASFPKFLWKKIKSLLIPYYLINGAFLVIQTLMVPTGIYIGSQFSIKEWLLQPWIRPEPYTLAHPTWFLIALFLSEIFFLLLRKLVGLLIRNPLAKEWFLLLLTLALSCGTVYFIYAKAPGDVPLVYLRSVFLLFYLQLGTFYKKVLEKHDRMPGALYFLIIFVIQAAIILYTENSPLYYSYVLMQWFGRDGLVSIVASMNGIALWLRISRYLAAIPKRSKFIIFIGDNTKYIMAFHLAGFFLMNGIFYYIHQLPGATTYLPDFETERFLHETYYACIANPRNVVLYFVAGMAFSLLLAKIIEICRIGSKNHRS